MRKIVLLALLLLVALTPLLAEDNSTLGFDVFAGLNWGMFTDESVDYSNTYNYDALNLFGRSFRVDIGGSARYYLTKGVSVGGEISFNYLYREENDIILYSALDIPVHAIIRVGGDETFLQVFGGYYWAPGDLYENFKADLYSGPEVGTKIALGGTYISGSYIFGDQFMYPRITIGYTTGLSF